MARISRKTVWIIVILLSLLSGAVSLRMIATRQENDAVASLPSSPLPDISAVSCLGRIAPEDKIIKIAARALMGQPSIVSELKAKEGEHVKTGDLLAVLNSKEQLEVAWQYAEAQIQVARSRLAQVKAGTKESDLNAKRAEIARIEAELVTARTDLQRAETLRERNVTSLEVVEHRRLEVETKLRLLDQAREQLKSLAEVRQVDVNVAAAEVEAAIAEARHAKSEFEQTLIRSPASGQVLEIHAWPGEEVGPEGILELAKTDQMYAIAEVLETDIHRVALGQRAVITGEALSEPMEGTVDQIKPRVAKSSIYNMDPASFSDTRIFEVKIKLNDSEAASGLINAQVTVLIKP